MSVKFGTSGLRGLSVDLIGVPSALYTAAFCRYLQQIGKAGRGSKILVGQDFRASSPEIAASCMGVIADHGLQPIDCGTLPTPALASYGQEQTAASLMITGSHIPADRNGIKFYLPEGEISKEDELAISSLAKELDGAVVQKKGGGLDKAAVALDHFLARCQTILPRRALTGLKVGVYQHSTVARDLLINVILHYGAEVVPLGRSDAFIPVDTEAVSEESISLLKQWSRDGQFDAIVSADGDGDRPLVIDERGQPLRGDLLGLMTAQFLGAKTVVTPVTSNSGIEENGNFEVLRTKVGSPYVIEAMNLAIGEGKSSVVGFEANGGFLTGTDFSPSGADLKALPTRDCVLPILSALFLIAGSEKSLSLHVADFSLPVARADRIKNFAQERSSALMSHLKSSQDNLAAFLAPIGEVASVNDTDGLRVILANRRMIHFRPSGNAPEMRCYVEAENEREADLVLESGLALIKEF